jgi:hypothetical protein
VARSPHGRQAIKEKGKLLCHRTEILSGETEIRPFLVDMPDEALADPPPHVFRAAFWSPR